MESQIDLGRKAQLITSTVTSRVVNEQTRLLKHRRIGEDIIGLLLFACGAFSIFITVSIIIIIGSQALGFFAPPAWLQTFRATAEAMTAEATTMTLNVAPATARTIEVGDILRFADEQVRVTAIAGDIFTIERGVNDTEAFPHAAEVAVDIAKTITLADFFTSIEWEPRLGHFGIWPLLTATLTTSVIAMLVAIPLGLSAAIYLSEYANSRVRGTLKPILEVLAGVPTVVYGFFALVFVTPLLQSGLGKGVENYNMLAAGLIMGVMILPTISSISEDALSAVPRSLREASYALGATRFETIVKVILPAALSGIVAAFILGISRAIGETMIVTLAAGSSAEFTVNPFQGAQTMTGYIANASKTDLAVNSLPYNSIFVVGISLFFITLILNIISRYVTQRFREVYQ